MVIAFCAQPVSPFKRYVMSFRRGGGKRRRDAIEPEVIRALRDIGVEVHQINGHGLPDLLCRSRGAWLPLGVKSGENAALTPSEREKPPSWPLVHSVAEALALFGVQA